MSLNESRLMLCQDEWHEIVLLALLKLPLQAPIERGSEIEIPGKAEKASIPEA